MFGRRKHGIEPALLQQVILLQQRVIAAEESRSATRVREVRDELLAFIEQYVPSMGIAPARTKLGIDVMRWAIFLESQLPDCNWARVAVIAQMHAGAVGHVAAQGWLRNDADLEFRRMNEPVFVLGAYASHRCSMPAFARMLLEHVSGNLHQATQGLTAVRAVETDVRRCERLLREDQLWALRFRGEEFWDASDRETRVINRRLEDFRRRQLELTRQAPRHRIVFEAELRHCVTELAAVRYGHDVVYLVASPLGGVAIRVFADEDRLGSAVGIDLPALTTAAVDSWQTRLHDHYRQWEAGETDIGDLRDGLDHLLAELGSAWSKPVRQAWPELTAFAVVPVGAIATLPLAAALTDGCPAQLIFEMTVAPDAGTLLAATLHERRTAGNVVVAVDPSTGAAAIPKVRAEGEAVAAVHSTPVHDLGGDAGQADDGPDRVRALGAARAADIAGVLALQPLMPYPDDGILDAIGGAWVVHLACHGVLVEEPVHNSALLLGPEPLSLSEFLLRPVAPGGVVVLSSCYVGGVVRSIPNELLGFPAAFLSAGARTVIASTLPVFDSRATIRLLVDLHRGLKAGADGRTALRAAVVASRERGDPSIIWAGFTAYGA